MQEQRWMTVREAAAKMGLCKNTVRKYAGSGELKSGRAGNRWRFLPSDVEAFMRRQTEPVTPEYSKEP